MLLHCTRAAEEEPEVFTYDIFVDIKEEINMLPYIFH
jgi:hypothetical protein